MPVVSLCGDLSTTGGYTTYFAEVFDSRPAIADIQGNVVWINALQANFRELLMKPSIPVKSMAVYIDVKGAFLVVVFKRPIQKANVARGSISPCEPSRSPSSSLS